MKSGRFEKGTKMKSKSEAIFEKESINYFNRNFLAEEYLTDTPYNDFTEIVDTIIRPKNFKVLEVGCGCGTNLRYLFKKYDCQCCGMEPNKELVNKLNSDHQENGLGIKFLYGFSNHLAFEDNMFDLVVCWSVLHWVDRNQILQTLGEMFRVTNKYILLMDFCPFSPYKTPYKHQDSIYTYKIDYADIYEKTGCIKQLDELYYFHPDWNGTEREHIVLAKNEYQTTKYDWVVRKRVLFEKNLELLPIKDEGHFRIIEKK